MTGSAVFLPGTLCDERVFCALPHRFSRAWVLDHSACSDAATAARHLVGTIMPETVGIAFSLGSWVLLEMARMAPERFTAIVLISGNAYPDAPENAFKRHERVARGRDFGFDAIFADEWDIMLGTGSRDDAATRSMILDMAEAVGHDRHARQAEMNINRPDLRAFVANPPMPIHVVAGTADGLCPRDRYEQAASGAHSTLTLLDGIGHYVPLEAPEALANRIDRLFPEYAA